MENKEVVTANLSEMGQEIQAAVLDGFTLVEGYPMKNGWVYTAILTRDTAPKAARAKKEDK